MKYFILTIFLLSFWLMWCNQKKIQIQKQITSWYLSSSVEIWTDKNLWGTIWSWIYLNWLYFPIIITGNTILFSWIYSIKLPKEMEQWEYITQINANRESIWFTDGNKNKSFNIKFWKIFESEKGISDKELCKVEYYDWYLSKSENIRHIQDKTIYIYYATLMVSAPDIKSFKVIDTQFCFIDSGMIYRFSASSYTHNYMNQIIDSFTFLN